MPLFNPIPDPLEITSLTASEMLITGTISASNYDGINLNDIGAKDLAGIENRVDSTLSFVNGTRELSITPTGANFVFWSNNVQHVKTVAQTVTIPNTVALYFVYFDFTGTLTSSTSPWNITSSIIAPVATVYWTGVSGAVGDERHASDRDRHMHQYMHNTRGSAYDNGLAGTFTNTTLSIDTGVIYDEDIRHSITGPVTTCSLWHRAPGGATMTFSGSISTPYKLNGTDLQYDNAGTLTSIGNNNFVTNWVYATNDIASPISVVVGQSVSNTLNQARDVGEPSWTNLTTREFKLLYKLIYKQVGATPTYIESVDYRTVSSLPGGNVTSLPATSVTFVPFGTLTGTNVQDAIEKLESKPGVGASVNINVTGTLIGAATTINFVGSGATASFSAGTAHVTLSAGGAPNQDTGWITATLTNSWQNFPAYTVKYRKINGIVYTQGVLNVAGGQGATGTSAFTLPVGYRPAQSTNKAAVAASYYLTTANYQPDGTVICSFQNVLAVYIDVSHCFPADG